MEEALRTYIRVNKTIGGWTDWVQGAGGNCSVKFTDANDESRILVKQSGTALADAKWVCCNASAIRNSLALGEENIEHAITGFTINGAKPSIEAFFHCLPAPVIVHLHPAPLLPLLCRPDLTELHLTGFKTQVIEYAKPGIPLAALIAAAHERRPDTNVYFLKNHGVLLLGESLTEILGQMAQIANDLFPASSPRTNMALCSALAKEMPDKVLKSFFNGPTVYAFRPYSPDIAVFLQSAPLCLSGRNVHDHVRRLHAYREEHSVFPTVILHNSVSYVIGQSLLQCYGIYEILYSYMSVRVNNSSDYDTLRDEQVHELVNWDKEKERRRG